MTCTQLWQQRRWFCIVSGILVAVAVVFGSFGLQILPVDEALLVRWASAISGAIMMGWGVTLFLLGRLAFGRHDKQLMVIALAGITVRLVVEALASLYLGVFFNVGVTLAVLALFSIPLLRGMRRA